MPFSLANLQHAEEPPPPNEVGQSFMLRITKFCSVLEKFSSGNMLKTMGVNKMETEKVANNFTDPLKL